MSEECQMCKVWKAKNAKLSEAIRRHSDRMVKDQAEQELFASEVKSELDRAVAALRSDLRDEFAKAALVGWLCRNGSNAEPYYVSAKAYEIADGMMKARERKP